jgi:hypothetical protein
MKFGRVALRILDLLMRFVLLSKIPDESELEQYCCIPWSDLLMLLLQTLHAIYPQRCIRIMICRTSIYPPCSNMIDYHDVRIIYLF